MKCSDIFHKAFLDSEESKELEIKLAALFEETIDAHPKEVTRAVYDINASREGLPMRDALWFGKAEYADASSTECWLPLYRIPGMNTGIDNPMDPKAAQGIPGSFDKKLRRLEGEYEWLMRVLDGISDAFGLEDNFRLNHCVVHRYMGKDDKLRRVHKAPDKFNPHHDKIVDLNLHHLPEKFGVDHDSVRTKPMIFSLSIGADRDFIFEIQRHGERHSSRLGPNPAEDQTNEEMLKRFGHDPSGVTPASAYTMSSGDLICMSEALNLKYKHGVDPGYGVRYSITARTVHTYSRQDSTGRTLSICPYFRFARGEFCMSPNPRASDVSPIDKGAAETSQETSHESAFSTEEKKSQRYMLAQHLALEESKNPGYTPTILLLDDHGAGTDFILRETARAKLLPVCLDPSSFDTMDAKYETDAKWKARVIRPLRMDVDKLLETECLNPEFGLFDVIWLDYCGTKSYQEILKFLTNAYLRLQTGGLLAVTRSTRATSMVDYYPMLEDTVNLLKFHLKMSIRTSNIYPGKSETFPMLFIVAKKKDANVVAPREYWDTDLGKKHTESILGRPMLLARERFENSNQVVTCHVRGVEHYLTRCGPYTFSGAPDDASTGGKAHIQLEYCTILREWTANAPQKLDARGREKRWKKEWISLSEARTGIETFDTHFSTIVQSQSVWTAISTCVQLFVAQLSTPVDLSSRKPSRTVTGRSSRLSEASGSTDTLDVTTTQPKIEYVDVSGRMVRSCGTPGCTLPDGHDGLCNTSELAPKRRRTMETIEKSDEAYVAESQDDGGGHMDVDERMDAEDAHDGEVMHDDEVVPEYRQEVVDAVNAVILAIYLVGDNGRCGVSRGAIEAFAEKLSINLKDSSVLRKNSKHSIHMWKVQDDSSIFTYTLESSGNERAEELLRSDESLRKKALQAASGITPVMNPKKWISGPRFKAFGLADKCSSRSEHSRVTLEQIHPDIIREYGGYAIWKTEKNRYSGVYRVPPTGGEEITFQVKINGTYYGQFCDYRVAALVSGMVRKLSAAEDTEGIKQKIEKVLDNATTPANRPRGRAPSGKEWHDWHGWVSPVDIWRSEAKIMELHATQFF